MYNIIDQELLDWVSENGFPANAPKAENNFSHDDIGDWEGEEELATQQLNWIMLTLETTFQDMISAQSITSLKSRVWRDWSKDTRILSINAQDVMNYVETLVCSSSVDFLENAAA